MHSLLSVRHQLHSFKFIQGIYLGFASLFLLGISLLWGWSGMQFNATLNIFIILIASVNGLLAWFLFPSKHGLKTFVYGLLFSLLGILLSKYLFYMHFFHLQSSFIIDKSEPSLSLAVQYLHWLDQNTFRFFLESWFRHFSWLQLLWILPLVGASCIFILLRKAEESYLSSRREKAEVARHVIKRRF